MLALVLPSFLCTASCVPDKRPQTKNITPDSSVYSMLGRTMSDVLFNPNSVTCYTLRGVEKADSVATEIEPHWVRDSLVGRLTPQMYGILQFVLISNIGNYEKDTIRVKAPYIPSLEFEFRQKKSVVHVLISTSDYTWTVMYDDKRQLHFNYQDRELISRFCEMIIESIR